MFSGSGLEATQVRYFRMEGGARVPLSRDDLTAAGVRPPVRGVPTDASRATAVARQLCRAFGADADVRFTIRTARRSGWSRRSGGAIPRCAPPTGTPPARR